MEESDELPANSSSGLKRTISLGNWELLFVSKRVSSSSPTSSGRMGLRGKVLSVFRAAPRTAGPTCCRTLLTKRLISLFNCYLPVNLHWTNRKTQIEKIAKDYSSGSIVEQHRRFSIDLLSGACNISFFLSCLALIFFFSIILFFFCDLYDLIMWNYIDLWWWRKGFYCSSKY